jgi:hypothetical protein
MTICTLFQTQTGTCVELSSFRKLAGFMTTFLTCMIQRHLCCQAYKGERQEAMTLTTRPQTLLNVILI